MAMACRESTFFIFASCEPLNLCIKTFYMTAQIYKMELALSFVFLIACHLIIIRHYSDPKKHALNQCSLPLGGGDDILQKGPFLS